MITEISLPVEFTPIVNTADMSFVLKDRCILVQEIFDADAMIREALVEIKSKIPLNDFSAYMQASQDGEHLWKLPSASTVLSV